MRPRWSGCQAAVVTAKTVPLEGHRGERWWRCRLLESPLQAGRLGTLNTKEVSSIKSEAPGTRYRSQALALRAASICVFWTFATHAWMDAATAGEHSPRCELSSRCGCEKDGEAFQKTSYSALKGNTAWVASRRVVDSWIERRTELCRQCPLLDLAPPTGGGPQPKEDGI